MEHSSGRLGMDQGGPRDSYASGAVYLQSMRRCEGAGPQCRVR